MWELAGWYLCARISHSTLSHAAANYTPSEKVSLIVSVKRVAAYIAHAGECLEARQEGMDTVFGAAGDKILQFFKEDYTPVEKEYVQLSAALESAKGIEREQLEAQVEALEERVISQRYELANMFAKVR